MPREYLFWTGKDYLLYRDMKNEIYFQRWNDEAFQRDITHKDIKGLTKKDRNRALEIAYSDSIHSDVQKCLYNPEIARMLKKGSYRIYLSARLPNSTTFADIDRYRPLIRGLLAELVFPCYSDVDGADEKTRYILAFRRPPYAY